MTNDRYLIVSYFVCASLSVALGAWVYAYLRRSFAGVAEAAAGRQLSAMLKRLSPAGLIFPAALGFLSVSYQSCNRTTYAEIVASRGYLLGKNYQQISATLFFILIAILFWNLVAILILRFARRSKDEAPFD